MDSLLIVVGTQSGNAAMVAETVKITLGRDGINVELLPEDCVDPFAVAKHRWLLICCSSHGEGDVPDNLVSLMSALTESQLNLCGLAYGVISLGDKTYSDTFCGGGRRVDSILSGLGAQRIGGALEIDASTQPFPDEAALAWLPGWIAQVRSDAC